MEIPPELFTLLGDIKGGIGRLEQGQEGLSLYVANVDKSLKDHKADKEMHAGAELMADRRASDRVSRNVAWAVGICGGLASLAMAFKALAK
jgi:hypothetical protein